MAEPCAFHGPSREFAEAVRIFCEVENRKYFPSARCITAGSRTLVQAPLQSPGSAYAFANAPTIDGTIEIRLGIYMMKEGRRCVKRYKMKDEGLEMMNTFNISNEGIKAVFIKSIELSQL